jgi:2-methylcitrate dehydratase PrpD
MNRTLAEGLGDFVASLRYEDVPDHVLAYAKRILVDTLACTIGGCAMQPRHHMFVRVARDLGGAPVSTILVSGERVDPMMAAMVNAEAGGALSAQESLYFTHTANVSMNVALALTERDGIDGRGLLLAFLAGYEVTAVLGLLKPVKLPPARIQVGEIRSTRDLSASVGAAAAAAKALGLGTVQVAHALAIAAATAPGDARRPRLSCLNYVGFHHKAQCGLLAALLAQRGFTGYLDALDQNETSLAEVAQPDRDCLIAGVGSKWWILDTCVKLYPTCRYLLGPLEQFQRIVSERNLRPTDIEHVVAHLSPLALSSPHISSATLNFDPMDPAESLNLVFNAPYQLALVALGVPPGPAWYDPLHLARTEVREFAQRVTLEHDVELGIKMIAEARKAPHRRATSSGGSGVTVHAEGKSIRGQSDVVGGDPWNSSTRITDQQLLQKLRTYGDSLLPADQIDEAFEMVLDLENVRDVREITRLLVAP